MDSQKDPRQSTGDSERPRLTDPPSKSYWGFARYANFAFSFGVTMAASILIGLFGGRWLDGKLGTSPWLMVVGLLLGVGIAFKSLFDEIKMLEAPPQHEEDEHK
ncbi:MAG: AtpZ/AtpI family protein [Bacillota bacterium]